jgi:hypothetical protein
MAPLDQPWHRAGQWGCAGGELSRKIAACLCLDEAQQTPINKPLKDPLFEKAAAKPLTFA